jgi:cobaltochelatase CobT
MAADSPLERLRNVLGGTARALSGEAEAELAFTSEAPRQDGRSIKVPMPSRSLPAEQVAEARGFADGFALRMRHHDTALHLRGAPKEPVARAVFDAVETARIEALGSRGYAGIAANLEHSLTSEAAFGPDRPRAQPRGSAAVDRARADGSRAADRARGARPAPRWAWR